MIVTLEPIGHPTAMRRVKSAIGNIKTEETLEAEVGEKEEVEDVHKTIREKE